MIRKDFIQRQFEEFGKALAHLLLLKQEKDWDNFEKKLAETTKKFTGSELTQVTAMDEAQFNDAIIKTNALDQDQKKIMARLLFEKLDVAIEREQLEDVQNLKQKCMALYQHLQANSTQNEFDLDVHYKLEVLKKMT